MGLVVQITVPVDLRKDLQNITKVVNLRHFVATLGGQMRQDVSLGAFKWESKILFVFATR